MKISFLTAFSLSCAISLGIYSTSASAIQYYKWVDAKGVTHYTKTPPPKSAKKPPQWIPMAGKIQHQHHLERLKLKCKPRTHPKKNSNKPLKFLRIRTSNNVKPTKLCSNLKIVQSLYKTPPYRTACFFFGKCWRKIHF